jgi:hypothetical protein
MGDDDNPAAVQAMMDTAKNDVVLGTLQRNDGSCSFQTIMDYAEQVHCDVTSAALLSLKREKKVAYDGMMLLLPTHTDVVVRLEGGGGSAASAAAPAEYVALKAGVVREGCDINSPKVGKLSKRSRIVVLERRLNSDGVIRVRYADGWTSEQLKDGTRVLELVSGVAPVATLSAPAVAPAPAPAPAPSTSHRQTPGGWPAPVTACGAAAASSGRQRQRWGATATAAPPPPPQAQAAEVRAAAHSAAS